MKKPSAPRPSGNPRRRPSKPSAGGRSVGRSGSTATGRRFDPRKEKAAIWVPGPNARTIRSEVGQDLAHFLVAFTKDKLSVRKARNLLEGGCCRVNGRVESFGSYELQRGDIVEFLLPEDDGEHTFDPKRIIYEDLHLLAYDKPPSLPVTPQDGVKSWSLLDILKQQQPQLLAVHRLDADTSGIVLFAKTPACQARLETLFKDHGVQKTYHAVVRGHPRESGQHRSYLVKVEARQGYEHWKSGKGADAREAITTWEVEERLGRFGSLVRVMPKTGRYHQIRIHFGEIGHSLYGDRTYGDRRDPVHVHRHLLHASAIRLPHPISGPELSLSCRLPRDMTQAMDRIRKA